MAEYAILKVREKTKKVTKRLAKKYELNMLDFTQAMVEYFDHTGLNPQDKEVLKPAEELKSLRNTLISFFRTQEKEYILPVFTKMDLLIGRFMQYLEEEAPKTGGANIPKLPTGDIENFKQKTQSSEQENDSNNTIDSSEELKKVKNDYERLSLKHKTMLTHLNNILSKTENKSTGLSKMPVVNMTMAEIEDIKKLIKKL